MNRGNGDQMVMRRECKGKKTKRLPKIIPKETKARRAIANFIGAAMEETAAVRDVAAREIYEREPSVSHFRCSLPS